MWHQVALGAAVVGTVAALATMYVHERDDMNKQVGDIAALKRELLAVKESAEEQPRGREPSPIAAFVAPAAANNGPASRAIAAEPTARVRPVSPKSR